VVTGFFETLAFAFDVTGPIFLAVVLGVVFKRAGLINDDFVHSASKLVFMVALPTLLFFSIVQADIGQLLNPRLLSLAGLGTFVFFIMLSLIAKTIVDEPRDRGVFIQGSFRGNLGIVGLAFCANAYGAPGLAAASIYLAVITILYNILSVYTLQKTLDQNNSSNFADVARGIARNPLMLSIISALILNQLHVNFHPVVLRTGEYFAQMTLPLALLCIGGSLTIKRDKESFSIVAWVMLFKLAVAPIMLTTLIYVAGFRGMDLGIVFLMSSAPTATVSFVMVQALRGNAPLAANIVVFTTLASMITVSVGLLFLKKTIS
jgi:malonate transporter and related proteins